MDCVLDSVLDCFLDEGGGPEACVVFSTHHHEVMEAFAGRVITLSEGRIVDDSLL